MGLADGANMTAPGVSFVPVGWKNPCVLDNVRAYTYFPVSWSNQTVVAVYPGFINVFGHTQYNGKVTILRRRWLFAVHCRQPGDLRALMGDDGLCHSPSVAPESAVT